MNVRQWARANGWPDLSERGRLPSEIHKAYQDEFGITTEPSSTFAECGCGRKWTGLAECHCRTCHRHFTTVRNFDDHQPGTCLDPAMVTDKKGNPRFKLSTNAWGDLWVGAKERPDDIHAEPDGIPAMF